MAALEAYRWPGNIRQLMNALERAQIMADDNRIGLDVLPREIVAARHTDSRPESPAVDGDHLADIQKAHILEVLTRERGNKARTARALGVNRRSLYRLLDKYNIQLSDNGPAAQASNLPAIS
jgi:transcriptional regulator of acetoin/glycerol metabolism